MIQAYLDKYTGSIVCSKQLYKEALNHTFNEPKQWEIRESNEIMNQYSENDSPLPDFVADTLCLAVFMCAGNELSCILRISNAEKSSDCCFIGFIGLV